MKFFLFCSSENRATFLRSMWAGEGSSAHQHDANGGGGSIPVDFIDEEELDFFMSVLQATNNGNTNNNNNPNHPLPSREACRAHYALVLHCHHLYWTGLKKQFIEPSNDHSFEENSNNNNIDVNVNPEQGERRINRQFQIHQQQAEKNRSENNYNHLQNNLPPPQQQLLSPEDDKRGWNLLDKVMNKAKPASKIAARTSTNLTALEVFLKQFVAAGEEGETTTTTNEGGGGGGAAISSTTTTTTKKQKQPTTKLETEEGAKIVRDMFLIIKDNASRSEKASQEVIVAGEKCFEFAASTPIGNGPEIMGVQWLHRAFQQVQIAEEQQQQAREIVEVAVSLIQKHAPNVDISSITSEIDQSSGEKQGNKRKSTENNNNEDNDAGEKVARSEEEGEEEEEEEESNSNTNTNTNVITDSAIVILDDENDDKEEEEEEEESEKEETTTSSR